MIWFKRHNQKQPSQGELTEAIGSGSVFSGSGRATLTREGPRKRAIVPSPEEIRAAAAVLTEDRIAELRRGFVSRELVVKLMLEAAEEVRAQDPPNAMINRRG